MILIRTAREEDIPQIRGLARENHVLNLNHNPRQGFLFTLNSEQTLQHIVNGGLSKIILQDENLCGYMLVASEEDFSKAYSKEWGAVLRDNYQFDKTRKSAILLQAFLNTTSRKTLSASLIEHQTTEELFQRGVERIFTEGCLYPFNPRTYYVLTKAGKWKRRGFYHDRLLNEGEELDHKELDKVGGLNKLKERFPEGMVLGLYVRERSA